MTQAVHTFVRRRAVCVALISISIIAASYFILVTSAMLPPYTIGSSHPEVLTMESFTISYDSGQANPTILSMVLRNGGTQQVTIATVTIQDTTTGSSSPSLPMNGQTVPAPYFTSNVTVDTLSSGFYFMRGHSYLFNIVTSKQTHMSFGPVTYS
jgi:hypothetical protein